jgi:hypothetical protein
MPWISKTAQVDISFRYQHERGVSMRKSVVGWGRFCVSMALICFFGSAAIIWDRKVRGIEQDYTEASNWCDITLRLRTDFVPFLDGAANQDRRNAELAEENNTCHSDAMADHDADLAQAKEDIGSTLGLDAAIILLGWSVAWILVVMVQWLRRWVSHKSVKA